MSHFFLVAFKVLSLSFEGLIVMYLGVTLCWVHFTWSLLSFFDVCIYVFHQIGNVSAIISSSILYAPFFPSLGTPTVPMLVCLIMSQGVWSSVQFFTIFFLSVPQIWLFPLSNLYVTDSFFGLFQSAFESFFFFFFCTGSFFFFNLFFIEG